jgi:hypothetical protein
VAAGQIVSKPLKEPDRRRVFGVPVLIPLAAHFGEASMKRMLAVIAVFGSICIAGTAVAQGSGGPGGFKKKFGPDASGGSIQRLEHQVEQLRLQILDLELYLKHGKSGWAKEGKGYGRGRSGFEKKGYGPPWGKGPGGFDKKGPWGYGPPGKGPGGPGFEKKRPKGFGPPPGKGPGGPGFDKKGPKGFGPPSGKGPGGPGFGPPPGADGGFGAFDKKAFNPPAGKMDKKALNPPATAPKTATTQERLDQIIREIGELRRALKKQ